MAAPPDLPDTSTPSQPPDHEQITVFAGRCKACGYDLSGLAAGACPECARHFDPENPASFLPPGKRFRKRHPLREGVLVALSLAIIIAIGMKYTVIPRPHILRSGGVDPRLWVWLDKPYGTMVVDEPGRRLRIHWWGDGINRISAIDDRPPSEQDALNGSEILWEIERYETDDWRVSAPTTGVAFVDILLAFNSMRSDEELLGVQIPAYQRELSERPFEVRGPRHAVLEKLIKVYGLEIRPGIIPGSPGDTWIWDEDAGRLERLSREEAYERGVEFLPHWGFGTVRRWDWRAR